jgi:hypothetical protein
LLYQREAAAILADWREVQRHLATVRGALLARQALFDELASLHAEAKGLRREYQALIREADRHGEELPPDSEW